jgi:hypothetical protein
MRLRDNYLVCNACSTYLTFGLLSLVLQHDGIVEGVKPFYLTSKHVRCIESESMQ